MSFHFNSLGDTIFHLFASLPFSYTFKLTTCIRTLLYLKIITSNNKVSEIMPSTSKNPFSSKSLRFFLALRIPLVTHDLKIYSSVMAGSLEHCTAKAVLVRIEILHRGLAFFFKFYFSVFLIAFFRWFINYFKESEVFLYTRLFTSLH